MPKDSIWEIFEVYRESVIVERKNKVVYLNASAKNVIPRNFEKEGLKSLLPEFILDYDSDKYSATVEINGKRHMMSVMKSGDCRIYTIYPAEDDETHKRIEGFLSSVTDQLRSALSSLHLASDLMKPALEKTGDSKAIRYLAMMSHNAHIATRIADNIDFLRKIISGNDEKKVSGFDINGLCRETVDTVRHLVSYKGINITYKGDEEAIDFAGDRDKIERLLLNLLSNSIKYTSSEGSIQVSLTKTSYGAILSVSDNGSGIKPEYLITSFERYIEARDMTDDKAGSGIGLSIVEYIAKLHGGSAVLESERGVGTKVTVMLCTDEKSVFRDGNEEYETNRMEPIITALSDVLPFEVYTPKYTD